MKLYSRSLAALLLTTVLSTVLAQDVDLDEAPSRNGPKYGTGYPPERTALSVPDEPQAHPNDSEDFHRPSRPRTQDEEEEPQETVFPPQDVSAQRKAAADAAHDASNAKQRFPKGGQLRNDRKRPTIKDPKLDADDDGITVEEALLEEFDDKDDEEGFFAPDEDEGVHDFIRWDSFMGSFSSIAATEIGDKTFIVAALMAMRHPKFQVFTAAFSALFIMTILSGITGHAVGALISKGWSALLAALLFLVFGGKSIKEGLEMSPDQGVSDEIKEVQAELEEKEVDMARSTNGGPKTSAISPYNLEAGRGPSTRRSRSRSRMSPLQRSPSSSPSPSRRRQMSSAIGGIKNLLSLLLSPAWIETFSMTFIGELGDRSQIATVAMAAGQEYYWVMVGATLGHFVCTAGAVLGGSVLAGRITMRKVTLVGGAIFIAFGLFTLLEALQYW